MATQETPPKPITYKMQIFGDSANWFLLAFFAGLTILIACTVRLGEGKIWVLGLGIGGPIALFFLQPLFSPLKRKQRHDSQAAYYNWLQAQKPQDGSAGYNSTPVRPLTPAA